MQTKQMQTSSTISGSQSQRGQALIEFALVLMFIILPITFVLMDGAMMLFTLTSMTNAAREAAHAGSIYQYPSYTTDYTAIDTARKAFINNSVEGRRAFASPLIPFDQCATTVTYDPPDPGTQNVFRALDSMSVTLACPHKLLFGIGSFGQITLTAQSTMRIEPGSAAPPTP